MLHQIKAQQFYTDLRPLKTVLNPPANGTNQGLFKALRCFSSTFPGKVNFQGLFKTVLYIQVLSTLCEPCDRFLSPADYLCKQFRPRSGPTEFWSQSVSKPFDTLLELPKEVFEIINFEEGRRTTTKSFCLFV